MEWQELIFTAGSVAFCFALSLSIIEMKPPAFSTSVMTAAILFLFSIAYLSMDFYWAGAMSLITSILWSILAYQRVSQVDQ